MDPIEVFTTAHQSMETILVALTEASIGLDGSKGDEVRFHLNEMANRWHDVMLCVSDSGIDTPVE